MILALSYFLISQAATIQHDTNLFTDWDVASFVCNSNTHTSIVTFSGTFLNTPKVFISQEQLDFAKYGNFEFSILSVTLISFTMQITCPTTVKVASYRLRWYAIDSPHIEVINCFNVVNPTQSTMYPHTIPDAIYGFVTFTSLYLTGFTDFYLSLSSIDSQNVVVYISSLTNLAQELILKNTNGDMSPDIQLQINKLFYLNLIGIQYGVNDGVRLRKTLTTTDTTITYSIATWCCYYIPNYISYVQIPYQYILVENAFKANRMIIRSLEKN